MANAPVPGRAQARAEDDEAAKSKQGEPAFRTYYLFGRAEVTGQAIEDAFVANDPQDNKPYVALNFNHEGAELFRQLTGRNVKRHSDAISAVRPIAAPAAADVARARRIASSRTPVASSSPSRSTAMPVTPAARSHAYSPTWKSQWYAT